MTKHWSPKGPRGRPSYTRSEMAQAEADSPLAVCEHHQRGIKVEVEYIGEGFNGEGFNGDFNPEDPGDVPLIRFRVFDYTRAEDDQEVGTYCTRIPATMPLRMLESFACALANRLADEESWKNVMQEWSWSDEADVRRIHEKRMNRAKKP